MPRSDDVRRTADPKRESRGRTQVRLLRHRWGWPPRGSLPELRGNLDNWDPALIVDLAANGRVITFHYEGVAGSNGSVAHTIAETAAGTLRILDADVSDFLNS
jgi:hypothetical protein